MEYRTSIKAMMNRLNQEKINTWFDLGLFIDRFKENKVLPTAEFEGSYRDYIKHMKSADMAFVTFHYAVDGVTIEVEKYAKIIRKKFSGIKIHYIAGEFFPGSEKLIGSRKNILEINELRGFDDWKFYEAFYFTKLERGSCKYNELIIQFWKEVKTICKKLGQYIEDNRIQLLYVINVCSNPGNVAFALALVLISEFLGIPVINNNHDFYWEGGSREEEREQGKTRKGPRDFFFTNAGVGEFFSIIEMIFPWESRSWMQVNINKSQIDHLIEKNGHNPANVTEIGTAVDTEEFLNISKRKKIDAYLQLEKILSRYKETLVGYSVKDVIQNKLVDQANPRAILIGMKTRPIEKFSSENIVFLQPTRIISRKRIEVGFRMIRKVFQDQVFIDHLEKHPNLKLTLLITGPIAIGQYQYFEKLIQRFDKFMDVLKPVHRERIYMACLFSELDKDSFKKRFENPVGIAELYNIASLILLPSKTEGRGLPIIEATACGTPIICRRYEPKDVYREVIGENLSEDERLKVIGFDGKNIKSRHVREITDRIFFPNKYLDEILHNRNVVLKRYSLYALEKNLNNIFYKLYLQLLPNRDCMEKTRESIEEFKNLVSFRSKDLEALLNTSNRQYLPGYGKLSFMLFLKSLIEPSYFRVEEQHFRGIALNFAREIITRDPEYGKIPVDKTSRFYNAVDNIFHYRKGEIKIRHDHSMTYRHRNKYHYPFRDYTIQEMTGIINLLYNRIIKPRVRQHLHESPHFFTDWNLALSQLTTSPVLAIDDRDKLVNKLHQNLPIALFPGDYPNYEMEFFVLQSVRARLNLKIEEELTGETLRKAGYKIAPVYMFAQDKSIVRQLNKREIIEYIERSNNRELKLLYKKRILRVVSTEQLSVGIHFPQLGENAIRILRDIQAKNGYIITTRRNATVMTDIVNIDRFHIGKVRSEIAAGILGIPAGSGYIQYVPAGIRPTLTYPAPIQTAKDFSETLKSDLYLQLCRKLGEAKVLEEIRKDAEKRGSPLKFVLDTLQGNKEKGKDVEYEYVSGVYQDGHPWNGIIARVRNADSDKQWKFVTMSADGEPMRVTTFCEQFEKQTKKNPAIAWNGGYILNPELVGKLGLPEPYIGSPLGMIISDYRILSAPLFNKAALMIFPNGRIKIKRVNVSKGLEIKMNTVKMQFSPEGYNGFKQEEPYQYFDLLADVKEIPAKNRIILRMAGNYIKEVIRDTEKEKIPIVPVGLTLSVQEDLFPEDLAQVNAEVNLFLPGMEQVEHAIEAGPMLLSGGKFCLDMELEGWKTQNSIRTQAARLDYTDMRGPKIAAGLDEKGNLSVLTINGRIRESVGATHRDMAEIMSQFGIVDAMGFDPGGSSTLVVEGQTKNISPYNSKYEKNIYSLPPEPRAVSNAVIGFIA